MIVDVFSAYVLKAVDERAASVYDEARFTRPILTIDTKLLESDISIWLSDASPVHFLVHLVVSNILTGRPLHLMYIAKIASDL